MRSGNKARKSYQTYWADLQPWIEQLYEDHRVYADIQVHLFSEKHGLKPTVEVRTYRVLQGREREVISAETRALDVEGQGHAEVLALQILSGMLLHLENEKDRAERQADLWAVAGE